jgi:hypothetical protein
MTSSDVLMGGFFGGIMAIIIVQNSTSREEMRHYLSTDLLLLDLINHRPRLFGAKSRWLVDFFTVFSS